MKTALWILVCLFFGLSAFEFAVIVAMKSRADLEYRLTQVERKQQYYASGEFKKIEKPKPQTPKKGMVER